MSTFSFIFNDSPFFLTDFKRNNRKKIDIKFGTYFVF